MEIFVAEDEADVTITYKIALEDKKHRVIVKVVDSTALKCTMTNYKIFGI